MYEKARRGENIELSPRRISIFQFEIERSLEDRSFCFLFYMYQHKHIPVHKPLAASSIFLLLTHCEIMLYV